MVVMFCGWLLCLREYKMDVLHVALLGSLGFALFYIMRQRAYIAELCAGIHEVHEIVKGMSDRTKTLEEKIKAAMRDE